MPSSRRAMWVYRLVGFLLMGWTIRNLFDFPLVIRRQWYESDYLACAVGTACVIVLRLLNREDEPRFRDGVTVTVPAYSAYALGVAVAFAMGLAPMPVSTLLGELGRLALLASSGALASAISGARRW